ncbi:MAG: TRAP transporter large permease [Kiritimatiellae bacterium]|nr:TRAP transporter large permease [Kiritimatiellia bacterium]
MNAPLLGAAGILVMLLALFLLDMSPGFVMALVGFVGLALITSPSAALFSVASEFWATFSNYGFTVIPLFILLGEFIYYAGYSDQLFRATHTWFGHRRGGLAVTTILASAGFSAICGSNTATAATMSAVALPAMRKYRYHPVLKTGAVAAGSTLGVMIPPSIVLVVYGLSTGQSIGKLFFGCLIPGLILLSSMIVTVGFMCRRHPEWAPRHNGTTWREKLAALPKMLDIFVLFTVIMVALFTGMMTATEAAGISCLLGLILCLIRRRLSFAHFRAALSDAVRISCMVFMIIAGATIFGRFLTLSRLPFMLAESIVHFGLPAPLVLLLMIGCYVIGGCLMDSLAFLLVSLPIFFPITQSLGYDPIWFGEVVCLVTTLGAITPPVGVCCYVIAGMAPHIRIEQVFHGSLYFIPSYVFTFFCMVIWPQLTVILPAGLVR